VDEMPAYQAAWPQHHQPWPPWPLPPGRGGV